MNKWLACLALFLLVSCTSAKGGKNNSASLDDLLTSSSANDEQIVFKLGETKPVITTKKRSYWLGLRDKKDASSTKKLVAVLAAGEFIAAETEARAVLAKTPEQQTALMVLAVALSMQGKHELANYYANLHGKFYPDGNQAVMLNVRGISAAMQAKSNIQDLRLSLKYFNEAFNANGEEIAAGLNLGDLYLAMGNAKAALETFAALKSRCNGCIPSLMGEGVAYTRLREFGLAKSSFAAVLKKQKNNGEALFRLAFVENTGFKNGAVAKQHLRKLLSSEDGGGVNKDIRQKAQILLRKIDASEHPDTIADKNKTNANIDVPKNLKVDDQLLETNYQE